MLTRNLQDLLAGLLIIAAGLSVSLYTLASYNLGTLRRMGPGMFPFGAGLVLVALGALVLLAGLLRAGVQMPRIAWRPLAAVSLAVAAFAVLIRPAGMFPAIAAMTVIAALAETRLRPLAVALLVAVLCLMAWLIFVAGLGLPIVLVRGWL